MKRFVARKSLEWGLAFLVFTFFSFLLLRLVPGDPVLYLLKVDELNVDVDEIDRLREELGFTAPVWVQYVNWLKQVLQLNLGNSLITGQPVTQLFMDNYAATFELAAGGIFVAIGLAVPLGTVSAFQPKSVSAKLATGLSIVGSSVPSFLIGLVMMYVFAVSLQWFPVMGRNGWDSLILPSLTLGIAVGGVYIRLIRSTLLDVIASDYVTMARVRGICSRTVLIRYIARAALPPVISMFGVSVASLMGGVVVLEVLFAYPGVGKLMVDSVLRRDFPVLQGYLVFTTCLVASVNLVTNGMLRLLQPHLYRKDVSR
ncbi:ABC transporter permease [Exiguobacterium aurantiacum]|uniref:ABC transporter permease n=1 Tax=Exiguobacterium aurantiacum TaxID=33987 RepID=A0ABY5FJ55_9BACL|nr:ABC transporter permease [Exiguobacterium aurantiacum]UTT41592.1 ABC transporter permease [Exiguobacterium aurantiacum]